MEGLQETVVNPQWRSKITCVDTSMIKEFAHLPVMLMFLAKAGHSYDSMKVV